MQETRVPVFDLGRPHMSQGNKALVPQLLSLCPGAQEPQLLNQHATATEALALEPELHN